MVDTMALQIQEEKTWVELLKVTKDCQELFEEVKRDVDNEELLPRFALALVQQHMSSGGKITESVANMLEMRLEQIKKREIRILIAGEIAAGKSTFVNILMGGDYLPTSHGRTTMVVCELRHHPTLRQAVLKFEDKTKDVVIPLSEDGRDESWRVIRRCITEDEFRHNKLEKIIIEWPLAIVQDLDCSSDDKTDKILPLKIPQEIPQEVHRPLPVRLPPDGNSMPDNFDSAFSSKLDRPYAHSFSGSEVDILYDLHQTYPKEVVQTTSRSDEPDPRKETNSNIDKTVDCPSVIQADENRNYDGNSLTKLKYVSDGVFKNASSTVSADGLGSVTHDVIKKASSTVSADGIDCVKRDTLINAPSTVSADIFRSETGDAVNNAPSTVSRDGVGSLTRDVTNNSSSTVSADGLDSVIRDVTSNNIPSKVSADDPVNATRDVTYNDSSTVSADGIDCVKRDTLINAPSTVSADIFRSETGDAVNNAPSTVSRDGVGSLTRDVTNNSSSTVSADGLDSVIRDVTNNIPSKVSADDPVNATRDVTYNDSSTVSADGLDNIPRNALLNAPPAESADNFGHETGDALNNASSTVSRDGAGSLTRDVTNNSSSTVSADSIDSVIRDVTNNVPSKVSADDPVSATRDVTYNDSSAVSAEGLDNIPRDALFNAPPTVCADDFGRETSDALNKASSTVSPDGLSSMKNDVTNNAMSTMTADDGISGTCDVTNTASSSMPAERKTGEACGVTSNSSSMVSTDDSIVIEGSQSAQDKKKHYNPQPLMMAGVVDDDNEVFVGDRNTSQQSVVFVLSKIDPDHHDWKHDFEFKFVFIDSPGITDKSVKGSFKPVLENLNLCRAFIFIIDTCKNHGVEETRLQYLMGDIETSFEAQTVSLNPDSSLFIANKIDFVPREILQKLRKEILQKLREKWPLVNRNNLIETQANQILIDMSRGRNESKNEIYRTIASFLKQTVRNAVEEHFLWLLNLLELIHAIAETGKGWSEFKITQSKLLNALRNVYSDALDLSDDILKSTDRDIRQCAMTQLQQKLQKLPTQDLMKWELKQIKDSLGDNATNPIYWRTTSEGIDKIVCERIEEKIGSDIEKIKNSYERAVRKRFQKESKKLENLQKMIHSMISDGTDSNVAGGVLTVIAPVIISGTVRLAPIVYPALFLAAPLLPIPLLIMSIIDEIRDARDESESKAFVGDKVGYLEKRGRSIYNKFVAAVGTSTDLDSGLIQHICGESKNRMLHREVTTVIEDLKYLLEGTLQTSEKNKKCSKNHLIETMKRYANRVINHDIKSDDIVWTQKDGIRKLIGFGGQAQVYEAEYKHNGKMVPVAVKEFHGKVDRTVPGSSLPSNIQIYRECFLMRQLSRKPNDSMVQFFGNNYEEDGDRFTLRLVLERCVGDLKYLINQMKDASSGTNSRAKTDTFFYYAKECTDGLKYLHDNNIVHRDVKPSNFLLKEIDGNRDSTRFHVVISDVGCSKSEYLIHTAGQMRGTPVYWAPEIALGCLVHSKASDVYSLGLVMLDLWFHQPVYESVYIDKGEIPTKMPEVQSVKDIISLCLSKNQKDRKCAGEIYETLLERRCPPIV